MTGARPAILGGSPTFPDRLPLVRPTLDDVPGLARRLERVLDSGVLTNGPAVRALEEAVQERLGGPQVIAVASCTAGLMLTYQALGLEPGATAVLPSFTFAASAHAVAWTGASLAFCEVGWERATADVADLSQRVDTSVRAISATHVYGHPAEVEDLERLASERGVPLVFDAAHALGSLRRGRSVGGFGTAEVFSLSPTKVVVAAEGGLVTTADGALAEAIRLGRDYGNPGDYDCRFPGLNARLSELHATVALASLEGLDEHIARREDLVARFASGIAGLPGLRIIRPASGDRSTWKDLTLVADEEAFGIDAATLQRALAADGIDSRRYYHPPIHRQQAYSGRPTPEHLPVTDRLAASVLTPPLWSHLADGQLDQVIAALVRIHEHAGAIADLHTDA